MKIRALKCLNQVLSVHLAICPQKTTDKGKKDSQSCDTTETGGKTKWFRSLEFGRDVFRKQCARGMLNYKCHKDDD